MMMKKNKYLVSPDIINPSLTKSIKGFDQENKQIITKVIQEKSAYNFFK